MRSVLKLGLAARQEGIPACVLKLLKGDFFARDEGGSAASR